MWEQYDYSVMADTVQCPGGDAAAYKELEPIWDAVAASKAPVFSSHSGARAVAKKGVGEKQTQIVGHLERSAANLYRHAESHPVACGCQVILPVLDIGDGSAATAAHQIVSPCIARQIQPL